MAQVKFNTALTYSTNIVEFWNIDGNGEPVAFHPSTYFTIARVDDPTKKYRVYPLVNEAATGYVKFVLDLGNSVIKAALYSVGDTTDDYSPDTYDHMYSVKADGIGGNTYVYGKLNLLVVA